MSATAAAAVFLGPGRGFGAARLAVPSPADREILVRVLGCTICGSDVHSACGRRPAPAPSILGHEAVGRVERFGPAAPRTDLGGHTLAVGDRVVWGVVAACDRCDMCRRGLPQKCERAFKYGHEPLRPGREWSGGLAEYCLLVEGTAVVRVPDKMPDEVACLAGCAGATATAALEAAGPLAGRTVCVTGTGPLGLTAAAMARAAGAGRVVCCDIDADRLARARDFGATDLAGPGELPAVAADGVDVLFECSGSPDAFEDAMDSLSIGAVTVLVGAVYPARPVELPMEHVVRRLMTVRGVHNAAPRHLRSAVEFLATTDRPFASLLAAWVPLAEVGRAFELAAAMAGRRVGVRP